MNLLTSHLFDTSEHFHRAPLVLMTNYLNGLTFKQPFAKLKEFSAHFNVCFLKKLFERFKVKGREGSPRHIFFFFYLQVWEGSEVCSSIAVLCNVACSLIWCPGLCNEGPSHPITREEIQKWPGQEPIHVENTETKWYNTMCNKVNFVFMFNEEFCFRTQNIFLSLFDIYNPEIF